MRARIALTAATAALLAGSLTACEGIADLPLPGGAATGSDAYRVTVDFADVLDLVPQSAVKVNDVTVGAVDHVTLDGWHARVTLRLRKDVRLPDNAVAELRQTSLLGEKFVSLSPPTGEQPHGRLSDGDTIPLSRTGRNPEVEEVLSALSLLLNGGGVAQLKTINVELTRAMQGHEDDIKGAISNLDTFIGDLDAHKSEVVRAIDGLDHLSATLAAQKDDIASAVDNLGPGLKVLADQRKQLTTMLTALSNLGRVGTRVINASKDDTIANLRALDPILAKLSEAGANLPGALEMLVTYPFPQAATGAVQGDYTNLRITADIDLRNILINLNGGKNPSLPSLPPIPSLPKPTVSVPSLPLPSVPLPTVPGVPGVPVPVPTSLPPVPPLPGGSGSGSGSGGAPTCVMNICIGAPAGSTSGAYNTNLARLMMGGLA
jgi:phospholipid/cholesterol/gamma-HCH transport system substrate-binding protein